MFSITDDLTYNSEGLATMRTAHQMASAIIRRDPTTHEHADRLARIVMRLFDQGLRDVEAIARKAADKEAAICGIKLLPDYHKLARIRHRWSRLPFH